MTTFNQAKLDAELSLDEGRRAYPYLDSRGIETVGIGHNLIASPLPGQTYPMTDAQIDAVFARDVASSVAKLDTYLPWWRTLTDGRQRAMLNMAFNLGVGRPGAGTGLLAFGTFLSLMKNGNYKAAAQDLVYTLWARQVGARATRIEQQIIAG